MSVLFGKRAAEQRSISYQDLWSTGSDVTRGDSVSAALKLVPVYAATNLIADSWASSPWASYDDSAGVPKKAGQQPQLLTNPAPGKLDVFSWRFQAATSCLLRGNAYGLIIEADGRGVPSKVRWLHPDDVTVDEESGRAEYYWKGRLLNSADVIHVPMYTLPGSVVGLSPISLFKLQIETGTQAQTFGRNFFKRGTVPPGWLKYLPRGLTPEQSVEAKRRFLASVSASEPMVSGNDWEYTPITVPAGEAQFLAGINATANQIAAVFRVAPEDVGGHSQGSTLTYKNLEQDQIRFNTRTLRPLAERFESVFDRYLPAGEYIKTNLDASARADLKTRSEAHEIGIRAGYTTIDEARALEERPPLTETERAQFLAMNQRVGVTP